MKNLSFCLAFILSFGVTACTWVCVRAKEVKREKKIKNQRGREGERQQEDALTGRGVRVQVTHFSGATSPFNIR